MKVSAMAASLKGSEILKLAGEINAKIQAGQHIYNLTIGDFNPEIFPIPDEFKAEIIKAYQDNITNYPPSNGIPEFRNAVSEVLKVRHGLEYDPSQILVAGGARPVIFAAYMTLLDPGDTVIYPVPSWNNNHYSVIGRANTIPLEVSSEQNFMPTAAQMKPHIEKARLIAVCSPLNPAGTTFSKEQLTEICELVVSENERRKAAGEKPLYLVYDQIYCFLTYGDVKHYNPVSLMPEMREYTIFVDGMSKSFASTGVRIGWTFGPAEVMQKMRSILGHAGAWSPKAEQMAAAKYLVQHDVVDRYLTDIRAKLKARLEGIYEGIQALKAKGYKVDAIAPQGAIYLTIKFDLKGLKTSEGKVLENTRDVTAYLLDQASLGIVPFYAFGAPDESPWYRLSVGTAKMEDIPVIIDLLEKALEKLS